MTNNVINLPMLETVYRSFMYVIRNIKTVCKISSIFILLWPFGIFVEAKSQAASSWKDVVDIELSWLILLAIASTIVAVSLIRHIILKEKTGWFHFSFGMNNIKFIGYAIFIFLFVCLLPIIFLFANSLAEQSGEPEGVSLILSLLALIYLISAFILSGRLYLVYAASAVNDKNISLASSAKLTVGNTLKISCGIVLIVIPCLLLSKIINYFYLQPDISMEKASFLVLLIMICSFLDSAIKASYYSHLYQYFTYFNKKETANSTFAEAKKETSKEPLPEKKVVHTKKVVSKVKTKTTATKKAETTAKKETKNASATPSKKTVAPKKKVTAKKTSVAKAPKK